MKRGLEFKVFGVGAVLLVAGILFTSLSVFFFQRAELYTLAGERLESTAGIITKSINRAMLEGRAEAIKDLIAEMKSVGGVEAIEVFNHEGREAFNKEARPVEAGPAKRLSADRAAFTVKEDGSMLFYAPLENLSDCQACHGPELGLLGAVKVSISLQAEQAKLRGFVIFILFGGLLGAGVLAVIFQRVLKRFVVAPIKVLEANAEEMAHGDLTFKTDIKTSDEIGRLSGAIKQSLSSISTILDRVKEIAGRISATTGSVESESKKVLEGTQVEAEAVSDISSSVEELNAAISEIAESTEGLAASIEQTASSIAEMAGSISSVKFVTQELSGGVEATSSSIEEMSAAIKEVAENAERLARVSEETLTSIEEIIYSIREVESSAKESARLSEKVSKDASTLGVSAIEKTMQGMQRIKNSVGKAAGVIRKLGGRSEEIGKILNVIDDITDQTTLLALNAAILAAQAKEHGKGFSVVAEEIKDLAERTAFSTQEIDALIQGVRQEVRDAGDAMDEGLVSVEEGLSLSAEASEALKKILESSKKSSEMAVSIERSTTEQAKAARLVSESIERVRAMVGQIAKATSEQSKGVTFIIGAVEKMKDASHQVKTATEQQVSASGQIVQAVEVISEKSQHISRAISEQKAGSAQIWNSMDKIKDLPKENRDLVFRVNKALKDLMKDSDLISAEMERFKLFEEKKEAVVRFGVVPLESPADMFRKFTPLAEYLSERLRKRVELKVAPDFATALKDLGKGATQLCYLTPSTYIETHKDYGAVLLVKALRDGRPFHRSVIITRADSGIKAPKDIKHRTFAFGDVHSTSSHIVPRAMLLAAGVGVEDLSYHNFLGHHDDVVKAVLGGEFDAGGVMESTAEKYRSEELYIAGISDEIPEFNISAGVKMSDSDRAEIKSALLALSDRTTEGARALKSMDTHYTGFVEAEDDDYNGIRIMMSRLGLIMKEAL